MAAPPSPLYLQSNHECSLGRVLAQKPNSVVESYPNKHRTHLLNAGKRPEGVEDRKKEENRCLYEK